MHRVADTRALRLGFAAAQKTHALHRFAGAFLPAFAEAKKARGWLDFDDLIRRTRALLSDRAVAQWVLFRLDGGIDHILIDEAQDTSPAQWEIVEHLTADFAAGAGARSDVTRTIFVVGDTKQSIYSFQGADPAEFDRMRAVFRDRLEQIEQPLQDMSLQVSFRSAPPILALVDAVAAGPGGLGLGDSVAHRAFHGEKPGRVDLWPVITSDTDTEDVPWDDPRDLISKDHHVALLARAIREGIEGMLDDPPPIGDRPLHAGDILILVRRRSPLFHRIMAELKGAGLPVAGVDRTALTNPLAVQDLLSLCRFLATADDDLSLAEVLRSPICGLSEAQLFDLAHGREGGLWQALRARAADYPRTHGMLAALRDEADFLRPFDLLERALTRHGARPRLIARLGAEAEDAIDALLSQALLYEATEVPSLTGFIGWLDAGDVQVKRDLGQAGAEIRVMTVHGAKGLEAPVVILPDCAQPRAPTSGIRLVKGADGAPLWPGNKAERAGPVAEAWEAADARAAEEMNRLLYVALTRAESWLIVAASGQVGTVPEASWYTKVQAGLATLGPVAVQTRQGLVQRLETGDWTPRPPGQGPDDRARRPARVDRPPRAPGAQGPARAQPLGPRRRQGPARRGG